MRRLLLASLIVLAFASSARAQTVIMDVDLNALGLGLISLSEPVDDDGDPDTEAWLIQRFNENSVRLVVVRADGSLCMEDPFLVKRTNENELTWTISRLARRDVIRVWRYIGYFFIESPQPRTTLRVITMDRVRCK